MAKSLRVPEDCEFPQLHDILVGDAFARALGERWSRAGADLEIERCTVDDFHYKPGGGCRLVFRVDVRERDGRDGQHRLIGHIPRRPDRVEESAGPARSACIPAVLHMPEWDLELWLHPNDRDLPGLGFLLDAERVGSLLSAGPERYGLDAAPIEVAMTLGKHVAGKRAAVKVTGRTARGTTTLFAKACRRDQGALAYTRLDQVWNSAPRREGAFACPRALAYDAELGIFWQEGLAGVPLNKDPELRARLPEMAEGIGASLAGLHRSRLDVPSALTFEDQLDWVRRAGHAVDSTYPEMVAACRPAIERLLDAASGLETGPPVVLHGSFRMSHVLSTPAGLAFIDFDGVCLGDPAVDLGRWIAHTYGMVARGKLDPAAADESALRLCTGYRRAAEHPVAVERIAWSTACHLLAGAMEKSVKRMDPRLLEELARRAERLSLS